MDVVTWELSAAGFSAALLLVYLVVTMLFPERF